MPPIPVIPTILIAVNNEGIREMLKEAFLKEGYLVCVVSTYEERVGQNIRK
jgi:DNA-binding response OmpR family regulator